MVTQDTLRETAREDDARVVQGQRKINAIQAQIDAERAKPGATGEGPNGESYAELVAEYEELAADMQFAETTYRAAQASCEAALPKVSASRAIWPPTSSRACPNSPSFPTAPACCCGSS